MKNIEDINKEAVKKILTSKKTVNFSPGDTIKVGVKIIEGKRERVQYFEGVCIAKKNRDINSSFTVRKISFGEGVERTFALHSPNLSSVKVIRSGRVKRAKLYYLRDRKGKSARIAEKIKKKVGIDVSLKSEENIPPQGLEMNVPKAEVKNEIPKTQIKNESQKVSPKKDVPKPEAKREEKK
ncbi:MAG: 50S ribosomal protein L19 [Pelagibacteraceae bacterium TMED216]|nr:MAG: 50S ribosomal protein L19 [Pelagibacteraceae bacterium TMED216]|tara:strand:+ start:35 stop:580 length:546 start_codon:yes stop_codon:yes gene_type:complete